MGNVTANAPVLQVEHLAKFFTLGFFRKKIHALEDVSIDVARGEIFGLLGPNGAGKTTTLKILMGLIRPTSGRVELLGAPVGDLGAKQQVGYLPESPYFYDYLTGRELVVFMAKLFGIERKEALRRADGLIERVGMTHAANLALRRYSKGMLQRIGLAQALINDPELIILDEPMTGLDPLGRKDIRELIMELRERGKTVLFSSHILSDVELLADRVAIVVKGRTVNSGPLHQLLDARILSTEVVIREPSPALLEQLAAAGYELLRSGETAQLTLTGEAPVDPVLDLIREHGGQVQMVMPRKESLEDVVVKQAQS